MDDLSQIAAYDQLASYAREVEADFPNSAKRTSAIALAFCARAARAAGDRDLAAATEAVQMLTLIGHMLLSVAQDESVDRSHDPIMSWIISDMKSGK